MVMPVLWWYRIKEKKFIERLSHIKKPYAISLALTLSWARRHLLHLTSQKTEKTEAKRRSAACPQPYSWGRAELSRPCPWCLQLQDPRYLLLRACVAASCSLLCLPRNLPVASAIRALFSTALFCSETFTTGVGFLVSQLRNVIFLKLVFKVK